MIDLPPPVLAGQVGPRVHGGHLVQGEWGALEQGVGGGTDAGQRVGGGAGAGQGI